MNELYLVSNSLGSDLDLPPRTKLILDSADLIIGEEQRTTSTLLKKLGISKPFEILNEHTKAEELEALGYRLLEFKKSCIVSDSGNPGICDPASRLVPLAWELGIRVRSCPGPSAFVSGLTASGFSAEPFSFLGFLPREDREREKSLRSYLEWGHTLVFYETPYRTRQVLETLAKSLGSSRLVYLGLGIGLETEVSYRGTAKEILAKGTPPKLPPVFVIEGKKRAVRTKNS